MAVPKIVKMEEKYPGIVNSTDKLLNEGLSYRKVAEQLRIRFHCSISYESVRQYYFFKNSSFADKATIDFYYVIKPILIRRETSN